MTWDPYTERRFAVREIPRRYSRESILELGRAYAWTLAELYARSRNPIWREVWDEVLA